MLLTSVELIDWVSAMLFNLLVQEHQYFVRLMFKAALLKNLIFKLSLFILSRTDVIDTV